MTITLHWWYLSILLFIFPFIFRLVRPYQHSGGWFDVDLDGLFILVCCWIAGIVFTLTKLFS